MQMDVFSLHSSFNSWKRATDNRQKYIFIAEVFHVVYDQGRVEYKAQFITSMLW